MMSDLPITVSSGERLSFYQLFQDKHLRVEIPLLQRDYAQGRMKEGVVRQAFLQALHRYLEEGRPFRDLDFVYGRVVNMGADRGCFVPLDGQQRLTTLFLLHWYLAQLDGKAESFQAVMSGAGRSYFTYETRTSSREFCHALVQYQLDVRTLDDGEKVRKPSDLVKDQSWFYLSWLHDPTIQSMLNMLDAIHAQFKNSQGYFSRLVDPENPVVTFLFLNLEEFKLTDDLYIKMNSRGKPLTTFENFKAQLEKEIKSYHWDQEYYLPSFSQPVSGETYFAYKMDTDWLNVFWLCRSGQKAEDGFDADLMVFIRLHLANNLLLQKNELDPELYRRLFAQRGGLEELSFAEYKSLQALSQDCVKDLMSRLDLLVSEANDPKLGMATYLAPNPYYDEKAMFRKIVANDSSFAEKLRFHAFYTAVLSGKRGQELLDWMRVVFNLTENSIVDGVEEYSRALAVVDHLAKIEEEILILLTEKITISGFSGPQTFEERLKAHLILKSEEWKEAILDLERQSFFKGQIGFALRFAGVVDYFNEHNDVDWAESENAHYLNNFQRYATAATAVFQAIEKDSEVLNYAWERAVLAKGDYLTESTNNRYNLLSTRLVKNNIERDHSWRRLFRLPLRGSAGFERWVERQDYVKAVFDDPDFDPDSIRLERSLENIARKNLPEASMEWQHLFRQQPKLFKECGQGFVVFDSDQVVLLRESQRNHYQSELYTKFLEYELERQKIDILPFTKISYESVRSGSDWAYLELLGAELKDQGFALEVFYFNQKYCLFFVPADEEGIEAVVYPKSIVRCLDELGFIPCADWADYNLEDWWGYVKEHYVTWCEDYQQAIDLIIELGNQLRQFD